MAATTKTLRAACLCGAAAHAITVPLSALPLEAWQCNCTSCRRVTGTMHLSVALLPDSYSPSQELLDKLTGFEFSKRYIYYHCTTCGCLMLSRSSEDSGGAEPKVSWDIMSGTLDQWNDVLNPKGYWHIQDTLDGGFAEFMPKLDGKLLERWPGHDMDAQQLPVGWRAPETAQVDSSPSDKLHAHCKCKGVEMWISRPSGRPKQAMRPWPDVLVPHNSDDQTARSETDTWWLRANGTKFLAGICACDSCRLASGADVVEWSFIPKADITLDAAGKVPMPSQDGKLAFGSLKAYQSSADVHRYFCESCGAMVFFEVQDRPGLLDVAVGLLDAPEGARAETWFEWRTGRVSYREDGVKRAEKLIVALEEGLKQFGRDNETRC